MDTMTCTTALRALGEESRMRLMQLLLDSERAVSDLAAELDMTSYNVSKHLRIMKEAGLIQCRKDAQQRLYSVAPAVRTQISRSSNVLDLGCCQFRFAKP